MATFLDIGIVMTGYIVVIVLCTMAYSFLSGGMLLTVVKAKLSRGKKCVIEVLGVGGKYYTTGTIDEGWLEWKDKKGEKRRKDVPDNRFVGDVRGVKWVIIDDQSNNLISQDYRLLSGYDTKKYEALYERAIMAGLMTDEFMRWIKIAGICAILAAIIGIVSVVLIYNLDAKVLAIQQAINGASAVI